MREAASDRALCLHEAAHAVTSEFYRPGSVQGIEMDYKAGEPSVFSGMRYWGGVEAVCTWDLWALDDPKIRVAVAAGREGEKIDPDPAQRYDGGDQKMLDELADAADRRKARRRAASVVKRHELPIRRLAKALSERRVMTGEEIREVIA